MSLQPAPEVQRVLPETAEPSVFEKECCVEYRFCDCRYDCRGGYRKPLYQSTSALCGSFVSAFRHGKLEIHKVFLRFPCLNLKQNSSLIALVDFIRASPVRPNDLFPCSKIDKRAAFFAKAARFYTKETLNK